MMDAVTGVSGGRWWRSGSAKPIGAERRLTRRFTAVAGLTARSSGVEQDAIWAMWRCECAMTIFGRMRRKKVRCRAMASVSDVELLILVAISQDARPDSGRLSCELVA